MFTEYQLDMKNASSNFYSVVRKILASYDSCFLKMNQRTGHLTSQIGLFLLFLMNPIESCAIRKSSSKVTFRYCLY